MGDGKCPLDVSGGGGVSGRGGLRRGVGGQGSKAWTLKNSSITQNAISLKTNVYLQ